MLAAVCRPITRMPYGAERQTGTAASLASVLGVALVLCLLSLLALFADRRPLPMLLFDDGPAAADNTAGKLAPPTLPACDGGNPGYLRGRIFGQLPRALDLYGEQLRCGIVLRPGSAGTRLLFQPAAGGLLLVIGLPAQPDELPGQELPVTVTLADENSGRFYSSAGSDRCWARFSISSTQVIAGELYCAGALPAVNRRGSVTLGEFAFALPRPLDPA